MEKCIFVIDLKAFYASFECVERGLDPFTTPLAVTDTERKEATIVLSVSPYLKSLGVPSRCRRRDLPKNIPGMILATPQMEKYVKASAKVVSIFLDFVGIDDIHTYSIDESFLNVGPYLKLYKCTPYELAKRILTKIKQETGLTATCGIGPNMFLAKMADDRGAKNKAPDYIDTWNYEDVPTKLWPIKPLNKVWGIAAGFEKRLNMLGLNSVYDVAHYPKEILVKEFGVLGEDLYEHANGRDDADIREKYQPTSTNLSQGQVLMRDYSFEEAKLILKEMNDELCIRLRTHHVKAGTVHLFIRYSLAAHHGEGYAHQMKLTIPTDLNSDLYASLLYLYNIYTDRKALIRGVNISFGSLTSSKNKQLSLFEDYEAQNKEEQLFTAVDELQNKYGKNSVLRADSLTKASTIKERHNQIGGHRK